MMHRQHTQEFQVLKVFGLALRVKAQVDSSSRVQKDFICREERKKAEWGHARGPGNQCSHLSG
jgi:hypothetical protein